MESVTYAVRDTRFPAILDSSELPYKDGRTVAVLHFASPASPPDYLKYPIQTLKVGALGTHNSLGLAMAKKAKYLLASTSECYGDPTSANMFRERRSRSPAQPMTPLEEPPRVRRLLHRRLSTRQSSS